VRATSRLGDNSNPLAAALRHIGPVSEDFYRAFGVGDNAKSIGTVDEGGVALAAIRGLYRRTRRSSGRACPVGSAHLDARPSVPASSGAGATTTRSFRSGNV
jgi:hypothetical protein